MVYITLPYLFVTLFAVWQYRHQLPLWLLWCYVPVMVLRTSYDLLWF